MDEHRKTFPQRVRSFVTRTLYLSPAERAAETEPEERRLRPYARRTLAAAEVLLLVGALGVVLYWAIWPYKAPEWTGFGGHVKAEDWEREKKLWDWFELLIVPVALAVGAFLLNRSERKAERRIAEERRQADQRIADDRIKAERGIAEDRQQEERLQAYFDRMTELLLEKGLRDSQDDDEVRSIIRTRTLTVLRTLDATRQGLVVRFLHEAGLIYRGSSIVSLQEADLRGADLSEANLREANLSRANLGEAVLSRADLGEADLSRAILGKADLSRAVLIGADLREAILSETDLIGAHLGVVDLRGANLSRANLSGADLSRADLGYTNLTEAIVTEEQLAHAKSLEGATMPDGSVHD
ncbi:MAG: pentapeptide repeat-containing protein [Anaerolineales bacterium]|nr:pentapeptide repeat-containing protein [Anaerolineales bacterium]